MTSNVGTVDRMVRAIVGLAMIAAAFGLYGAAYQTAWGWMGIIPLATGILGSCPFYTMLGIKTCTPAKVGRT
jgi:hypothetical protein